MPSPPRSPSRASRGPDRRDGASLAAAFGAATMRQDWAAAIAALDGLIALAPDTAALHYNRAVVLRRAGRPAEAVEAAARAVALEAGHDNARFEHAAALMDAGRPEARAAFAAYLARVPRDADARLNLARLALREGDAAEALGLTEGLTGEAAALARAEALRDLGRLAEMEAALAAVPRAAALKVRTQGAFGRIALDPSRRLS